jgi:hypothetical protein
LWNKELFWVDWANIAWKTVGFYDFRSLGDEPSIFSFVA